MILHVSSLDELSKALAKASSDGSRVGSVDLSAMDKVLQHRADDMTVTVQTGIILADLQKELASHGQWLPIDPPQPDRLTIDQLLNRNLSGPRRFGYGTIREHLLGITAVLPDGRIIHNGGKVVKNVAGFDLCKLFVGSQWSLGIMAEATFKVRPLPARELFLRARFEQLAETGRVLEKVLESELTPVALDLYSDQSAGCWLTLGFAGTPEEIEWQAQQAKSLGIATPEELEYERAFWDAAGPPRQVSVLPSRVIEELGVLKPSSFVARAGNGMIFYRGGSVAPKEPVPVALNRRVKEIFDPRRVLPDLAF